jgi:hypothetical protein
MLLLALTETGSIPSPLPKVVANIDGFAIGSTVTSDAELLAYRKFDDAVRLTSTAASGLQDTRIGQNTQHVLTALLRQSISAVRKKRKNMKKRLTSDTCWYEILSIFSQWLGSA